MAREKGRGNLQKEKSGRYTLRVGINGRRYSRSTGTTDREKAERALERFLAPLGLGATRLPLADAWQRYEMSPNRRDIAKATLDSKRAVWMSFSRWMEKYHVEIGHLAEVTDEAVAEYLTQFRCHHSATTYNNHVCALREVFRLLADKAGVAHDPWAGVCLLADDSVSRRELTIDELGRLHAAASKAGAEWKLLFMTGTYTGLRLGDCCRLTWDNVNLERQVIQVIPEKTKKHMHGRPVTIPIHASLMQALREAWDGRAVAPRPPSPDAATDTTLIPHTSSLIPPTGFVNPVVANLYLNENWRLDAELSRIFKAANITMSVRMEGRTRKSVVASFHSLRHTFVSLSANAGVPLPVVQSIVGHCSTAMTRHYYHENEENLRKAVAAIPVIGERGMGNGEWGTGNGEWSPSPDASTGRARSPSAPTSSNATTGRARSPSAPPSPIPARLRRLANLLKKGLITEEEHAAQRMRILNEL